jgi:mono/diheme cytochrome c family protein
MRRILFTLVLLVIAAAVFTDSQAQGQGNGNGGQSQVQRGLQIAPVPLNLTGKNLSLVAQGSYLVNGPADCAGCHTVDLFLPGGNPFNGDPTTLINTANYLGGGEPFGPFVSRNLTPDKNGRPAGYTFAQFEQVIRTGVDLKAIPPAPLLQVMPWPSYRHATDQDLRAIYEYLSAIPCLEGGPGSPANRCTP